MNININAVKFKTSEKLEEFIREKVGKLERANDEIIAADVTLKVDKPESENNKIVDIRLSLRGNDSFASKQADSFEEATLQCVDAIKNQLQRRKDNFK